MLKILSFFPIRKNDFHSIACKINATSNGVRLSEKLQSTAALCIYNEI